MGQRKGVRRADACRCGQRVQVRDRDIARQVTSQIERCAGGAGDLQLTDRRDLVVGDALLADDDTGAEVGCAR